MLRIERFETNKNNEIKIKQSQYYKQRDLEGQSGARSLMKKCRTDHWIGLMSNFSDHYFQHGMIPWNEVQ
jgi:hypothetical protein